MTKHTGPAGTVGGPGRPHRNWSKASTENLERRIDIACKRLSVNALTILERALDERLTPNLEYKYRIAAATQVLDRAWGKPKQSIRAEITTTPSDQFMTAMREADERAEAARKARLEKQMNDLAAANPASLSMVPELTALLNKTTTVEQTVA